MHQFQDGDEARVVKNGTEMVVVVFRQLGELVYAFDHANRAYQFDVKDVLPGKRRREVSHPSSGNNCVRVSAADADRNSWERF